MITTDCIRNGLEKSEFFLEYLPTLSLANGRCTGAEALIRWKRGAEILQPVSFIPVAENTTLSGLLTYWVIDTVALELGKWLHENPTAHLSINVPPEILGRGGILFAATKANLIDLAPQLIIEITERGLPDALGVESINEYRKIGIRVAMDDFSHGSRANMAILARANFDIIKLDKTLCAQITNSNKNPDWLAGITAMMQSSQLSVIAEGVETEVQHSVLKQARIQEAQGFYFSGSLSSADFIDFYNSNQVENGSVTL
jgi:sensor c-di-GMP phosphodiesterase-like protein